MSAFDLLSRIAATRSAYYELVEALEHETGASIDEGELAGMIDSNYPGRKTLTAQEAGELLVHVSRMKRTEEQEASGADRART